MATLKSKRGPIRAAFTRTWNDLHSEINRPDGNLDQMLRLRKQLEDRFVSLEKVDEQIDQHMQESEASEEEYTVEYDSVIEYRDKFSDIMFMVNNLEQRNNSEQESNAESSYHTNISCNARSKYKLPKLELRKFNGDPKEWLAFWSQFKGIHEDNSISEENKFQYLIQATVEKIVCS